MLMFCGLKIWLRLKKTTLYINFSKIFYYNCKEQIIYNTTYVYLTLNNIDFKLRII